MEWDVFSVGPLQTNGFVLRQNFDAAVIDPGEEPGRFIQHLRTESLELKAILLTHGHGDHIGALPALREEFPDVPVMCHKETAPFLTDPSLNLSIFLEEPIDAGEAVKLIEHGQRLQLGAIELEARHVPGHTPGDLVFYHEDRGVLFAGDSLFAGGVGRCDLPGGDGAMLIEKIRSEILTLADETIVWPGHGPRTTVGTERRHNPYLQPDFDPRLLG